MYGMWVEEIWAAATGVMCVWQYRPPVTAKNLCKRFAAKWSVWDMQLRISRQDFIPQILKSTSQIPYSYKRDFSPQIHNCNSYKRDFNPQIHNYKRATLIHKYSNLHNRYQIVAWLHTPFKHQILKSTSHIAYSYMRETSNQKYSNSYAVTHTVTWLLTHLHGRYHAKILKSTLQIPYCYMRDLNTQILTVTAQIPFSYIRETSWPNTQIYTTDICELVLMSHCQNNDPISSRYSSHSPTSGVSIHSM